MIDPETLAPLGIARTRRGNDGTAVNETLAHDPSAGVVLPLPLLPARTHIIRSPP